MLESPNELTLEKYRSKLKCHAKTYRKRVYVNQQSLLSIYRSKVEEGIKNNVPYKVSLGDYRHCDEVCNYNDLVIAVEKKWSDRDKILERDIIHSISNKCNDLILRILI